MNDRVNRAVQVVVGCAAMVVVGCATAAPRPGAPLTDVDWRLTALEGAPVSSAAPGREPRLRLVADGTRVTGFTTCNNFFGRYDAAGGQGLRFGELGSTKMACVDQVLARQEQRFMAALRRVNAYAVVGDTLHLLEGNSPVARFVASQRR